MQVLVVCSAAGMPGQFSAGVPGAPEVKVSELMSVLPVHSWTLKVSTWPARANVAGFEPVIVTVVADCAAAGWAISASMPIAAPSTRSA